MTEAEWHMFLADELKKVGVVTIGLAGVARNVFHKTKDSHEELLVAIDERNEARAINVMWRKRAHMIALALNGGESQYRIRGILMGGHDEHDLF
jgi:hypothetical protein